MPRSRELALSSALSWSLYPAVPPMNASSIFRAGGRCVVGSLLLFPLCCGAADPLATLEKAAGDWVKIRMESVRLETAWASEKPLLESTLAGLKERAATLEEKRDLLKTKTAQDRKELDLIASKSRAGAEELQRVEGELNSLVSKLLALRTTLPPRLSAALDLPYRSLAAADSELSPGERMQLVSSVLNRCGQFNRTVTAGEEILTLEGAEKLYQSIYWGLGYGYALDRGTGRAWLGSPTSSGWTWELHPEAAPTVSRLMEIYADEADPRLLSLPARLAHPIGERSNP